MIYHVGNLHYDRRGNRALAKIARQMWARYLDGEVDLLQRKIVSYASIDQPGGFEYHAIPKPRPWVPVTWLGGRRRL